MSMKARSTNPNSAESSDSSSSASEYTGRASPEHTKDHSQDDETLFWAFTPRLITLHAEYGLAAPGHSPLNVTMEVLKHAIGLLESRVQLLVDPSVWQRYETVRVLDMPRGRTRN